MSERREAQAPSVREILDLLDVRDEGRKALIASTALGVGAMACAVGLIILAAWLISRASQRPQESAVAVATAFVQLFALGRGLLRYLERLTGHDAAFRTLADLRVRVYARLEHLAPAGLAAFSSGELLARLVQDVDSLQDLLLRVWPPFAVAAIVGAATALVLVLMLPAAGLIFLAALVLCLVAIPRIAGLLARRSAERRTAAQGELTASVVDLLTGAPELTVAGAAGVALERAMAADGRLRDAALREARSAGAGQSLVTLASAMAMWGGLAVGVAAVSSGSLPGVLLAGLALAPLAAAELLAPLPTAAQALEGVRRAGARVEQIFDAAEPVGEPAAPAELDRPPTIVIGRLNVRYAGADRPAVAGIDLEIPFGSRTAIVGESGAGKTSLAWTLVRFLEYESGSVTVGGVELREVAGDAARETIGFVARDDHVFNATVRENLLLAAPSADDSALLSALGRVELDGWLATLPDGLATALGERGARMSGGERSRLAIARALLADFPVLILDEPGEQLDRATATAVLRSVLAARAGRTTVAITHRLAGLDEFDQIVVLDQGRVVQRGTHAALLAAPGRYAAMWRRETGLIEL